MKNNNKTNKIIVLVIIAVILIISLVVFILNYTKDSSSYSIIEKNWISNNANNIVDVSVYNDVPIYGENGEGIIFSYLDEFTNTNGITFNKIPYQVSSAESLKDVSFRILDFNQTLSSDDIELYKDYYVIVSIDNQVLNDLSDLSATSLGAFTNDVANVKYYLNDASDIKVVACDDIDSCLNLMESKEIDYLALPQNLYLDRILSSNLTIAYHLNDLYKQYVITVKNNKTLNSIMKKFLMIYEEEHKETNTKNYFLNTFFKYKEITEAEKMSYNSSSYTYGYVINMPYENTVGKEFVGTMSNYLNGFSDLANVEFKVAGYNNITELRQALSHGEVDLVFANYNTSGLNIDTLETSSPFKEDYVILSKENKVVNSIRSLKGETLYTVAGTYLADYLAQNSITTKLYNNTDELLRSINTSSIIIINKDTYEYYRDNKFKGYKVIYEDALNQEYRFVIRDVDKNKTFYELFNYYISSVNYKTIKYNYNTDYIINSQNKLSDMMKYTFIALGATFVLLMIIIVILKTKHKKKELNKEDKLKFIDVMTSLKNRNYLNYNIATWEENVIYPQAIIIIDLNNIQYINDNYGHTEGDEVIKKAAGILISNQLENTDIIRTDGNEFLIYMVGYEEKKVIEYTRKISKELKDLPHEFGSSIGYSMITDDVKTIDDAINEATLSMRQAKEKL